MMWYNLKEYNPNNKAAVMLLASLGHDTRKVILMHPHVTSNTYPDQTTERWLPVVGYEGIYEVSSHGRVRSLSRADFVGRKRQGRVLAPGCQNGYFFVHLCKGGNKRVQRVHKLVASAFLGERPEGCTVNHIDGDKTNNHPNNLEYMTQGDNVRHALFLGLRGNTVSRERIWEIREAYSVIPSPTFIALAKEFDLSESTIREIVRAKSYVDVPNRDGSKAVPMPVRRGLMGVDVYALHMSGQSFHAIARQYGADPGNVCKAFHKATRLRDLST